MQEFFFSMYNGISLSLRQRQIPYIFITKMRVLPNA
jgi:hypothetical protein